MGKSMSVDLRQRVVAAVDGGMSRRKAAEWFGVSISSAIRWTSWARLLGSMRPEPQGDDTRSARIEAFAPVILGAVEETPDITLVELRALLAKRGGAYAVSTIRRFFARHRMTLRESRPMRRSRSVPTFWRAARPGSGASPTSIPSA